MLFALPLVLLCRRGRAAMTWFHRGAAPGRRRRAPVRGKGRSALDAPYKPHPVCVTCRAATRRPWWLLAVAACLGLNGCQTWDEVTSRDFTVKTMFAHAPDP